MIDTS
jgi:hypothetical protein